MPREMKLTLKKKLKLKNERVLSQFIEAPKGLYFFESAKEKLFF